jgi:hypothetical protein
VCVPDNSDAGPYPALTCLYQSLAVTVVGRLGEAPHGTPSRPTRELRLAVAAAWLWESANPPGQVHNSTVLASLDSRLS